MPDFIGFEDSDTVAGGTTPEPPSIPSGQSPVAELAEEELFRCGPVVPPTFIGFEDTKGYLDYTTPAQPVTTNQQPSIKWLFYSIGLHLVLILLLFSGRTVSQTVLPLPFTSIIFEPADRLLATQTSLFQRGDFTIEESLSTSGNPGRLNGHVAPTVEDNSNKNAAFIQTTAPTPGSAVKRKLSAPILGQIARNEYLLYLTRRIGVLPFEVVGDRQGETRIGVFVGTDGEIARVSVLRGSGYPDIDLRVQQMVAAVGRLPPIASGEIRSPSAQFQLILDFKFGRLPAR